MTDTIQTRVKLDKATKAEMKANAEAAALATSNTRVYEVTDQGRCKSNQYSYRDMTEGFSISGEKCRNLERYWLVEDGQERPLFHSASPDVIFQTADQYAALGWTGARVVDSHSRANPKRVVYVGVPENYWSSLYMRRVEQARDLMNEAHDFRAKAEAKWTPEEPMQPRELGLGTVLRDFTRKG